MPACSRRAAVYACAQTLLTSRTHSALHLLRTAQPAGDALEGRGSTSASDQRPPMSSSTAASSPPLKPAASSPSDFPDDPFSLPVRASPYLAQHGSSSGSDLPPSSSNDSLAAWAKTTRFTVLNHFSHVTNVARNGAHTLLSSPLFHQTAGEHGDVSGAGDGEKGQRNHRTSVASLATSFLQHGPVGPLGPSDPGWKHSELAKKSGTGEYDSARVYLAKWAKLVAEEGEVNRLKEQESQRKAAQESRPTAMEDTELGPFEVWDLLPCIDKPESTRVKGSEIGPEAWSALFDEQGGPTVSFQHMKQLIFQHGFGKGKHNVNGTGWEQLGPRAECWSFLLGAQTWVMGEGFAARKKGWERRSEEYWSFKTRWSDGGNAEHQTAFLNEQKHRIRVDCLRVDKKLPLFRDKSEGSRRASSEESEETGSEHVNIHVQRLQAVLLTYVTWDQAREEEGCMDGKDDVGQLGGYVQGMSDLCAPLYSVCHGDEAKTFWLFVGLMERMRRNFYADQSGMKMQLLSLQKLIAVMDPSLYSHLEKADSLNLFFCFRWLLVCFKREFSYPDILMLWEAIWAANLDSGGLPAATGASVLHRGLSNHFQLFVALAILEHHRDVLIKYLHNFDELLQVSARVARDRGMDNDAHSRGHTVYERPLLSD